MDWLLRRRKERDMCIGKALPSKVQAALLKAYGKLHQLVLQAALLKSLVAALGSPKCLQ